MMSHDPPRRPEPSPRRVLLFFVVLSAAIAGAIGGLRGGGGDPVATLDLSRGTSSAPVSLRAGDLLRVRADLEFRHRASQLRGNPDGCEVTLSLREGTATRVQTRCALFPEVAVGASSSARWEPDGRVWRRLEGQRLVGLRLIGLFLFGLLGLEQRLVNPSAGDPAPRAFHRESSRRTVARTSVRPL